MSRITPLSKDKPKDKPIVKKTSGKSTKGKKMIFQEGTNLKTRKNTMIKKNLIRNSKNTLRHRGNDQDFTGKIDLSDQVPCADQTVSPGI